MVGCRGAIKTRLRDLKPQMENPPPGLGEGFMVELSGVEPLTS